MTLPKVGSLPECVTLWAEAFPDTDAVTFVDFGDGGHGVATTLTWSRLDRRISAVAARLAEAIRPGDRVAITERQGLDYVIAFLATQRAGGIAVPLFHPDLPGHTDRLRSALRDCTPAVALTGAGQTPVISAFLTDLGLAPEVIDIAAIPDEVAVDCRPVAAAPDDIAYLQYTSGSTRQPRGVMISNANVLANAEQALTAFGMDQGGGVSVSWLPLFHDMGLVLGVVACVVGRLASVLMDPVAFLQRPARWLKLLSTNPNAVTAAPNFAYGLAAAAVSSWERDWLRLDRVKAFINGAEPVLADTVDRFDKAFAECGLRPEAHRPCYGLAEATVLVAAAPAGRPPLQTAFDRDRLAEGIAVAVDTGRAGACTLVSCGRPVGQELRVVETDSGEPLPDDRVGEIWVRGPNVAAGYWGDQCDAVFGATLASDPTDASWMRTGDLGVIHGGELYVTGRLKDLVVVAGRNHYPQDIEWTVERAHRAVRTHHAVAFAVPTPNGEGLVVVAELSHSGGVDAEELRDMLRNAVSTHHGISVHDLLLVRSGTVPRTSSGKVARAQARDRYLSGRWNGA